MADQARSASGCFLASTISKDERLLVAVGWESGHSALGPKEKSAFGEWNVEADMRARTVLRQLQLVQAFGFEHLTA